VAWRGVACVEQIVSQTISESRESFKKFASLVQERIKALPPRKGVVVDEAEAEAGAIVGT